MGSAVTRPIFASFHLMISVTAEAYASLSRPGLPGGLVALGRLTNAAQVHFCGSESSNVRPPVHGDTPSLVSDKVAERKVAFFIVYHSFSCLQH